MSEKKSNPTGQFGYQPNNRKQDRQTNNGYQPTQSTLTTPPSKGSNVHPAKKDYTMKKMD